MLSARATTSGRAAPTVVRVEPTRAAEHVERTQQVRPVQTTPDDPTLEANSYAVAFRLLGDRPAARAVSGIATQRLRQLGEPVPEDWLALLITYTIDQTVGAAALGVRAEHDPHADHDPHAGMRVALRRRLERATPDERIAGSLIHLAGYPPEFVAALLHTTPENARVLAGVLAPPPGVAYRDLGDPELIGASGARGTPTRRRRRGPHWTTVIAASVVAAAVFFATQVTGPRPTLVDEGGMGLPTGSAEVVEFSGTPGRSAN